MAMTSPSPAASIRLEPAQAILLGLLAAEVALFAAIGTNFLTRGNAFEVLRLSVEIGLLAVALTPVIVGGGIDLSVGSLMGLSAVLFGTFWRDVGLPVVVAAPLTLVVGAVAGGLNGFLITRLRIPALIVTLGSFSLFRGLAEGWTGGVDNFTHFPSAFRFLGQGYLPGEIPTQLPVFLAVAAAFWVLLHRTTIGRALFAIGFSPEGRRAYRGLAGRIGGSGSVYVLSGGGSRAWRRSSTWPTSARRRRMRARAMNCWRSRPSCWAGRRSSVVEGASSGRSWDCSRSPSCRTG